MGNKTELAEAECEAQLQEAKDRLEQVEARVERARTRAELAESRVELAETRTELAEARAALAEARAENAEAALQRVFQQGIGSDEPAQPSDTDGVERARPIEHLSSRQREILRLIAEGQNTKQIAEMLNLSPKTVEYHRSKLMRALDVYDIPGLVRLAVRAGLVPSGS